MKSKPQTILIFNPEKVVLESLQLVLREEGLDCHTTGSVAGVWRLLERRSVDLIILDSQYADTSLIKALKKHDETMCILVMSAYSDSERALQALGNGADNYILKPLDFDELIAMIRDMLPLNNLP